MDGHIWELTGGLPNKVFFVVLQERVWHCIIFIISAVIKTLVGCFIFYIGNYTS